MAVGKTGKGSFRAQHGLFLVGALVAVLLLSQHSGARSSTRDSFADYGPVAMPQQGPRQPIGQPPPQRKKQQGGPQQGGAGVPAQVSQGASAGVAPCSVGKGITPSALLPGSSTAPPVMRAGAMQGMMGSVMRNANLQVRSEPVIKQEQVSPWMQSTISHVPRATFEIGCCLPSIQGSCGKGPEG